MKVFCLCVVQYPSGFLRVTCLWVWSRVHVRTCFSKGNVRYLGIVRLKRSGAMQVCFITALCSMVWCPDWASWKWKENVFALYNVVEVIVVKGLCALVIE